MAFALVSVQTSNSGTTSVTVTKPVSLAVSDLMVAHLACSNSTAQTLSDFTATGWTLIATDESNSGAASHRASAFCTNSWIIYCVYSASVVFSRS